MARVIIRRITQRHDLELLSVSVRILCSCAPVFIMPAEDCSIDVHLLCIGCIKVNIKTVDLLHLSQNKLHKERI